MKARTEVLRVGARDTSSRGDRAKLLHNTVNESFSSFPTGNSGASGAHGVQ